MPPAPKRKKQSARKPRNGDVAAVLGQKFSQFANAVARLSGRPITFASAVLVILIWLLSGPLFGYSDTWQLIINTGTTIVTFLMVFLIQNTQNRDGAAIQAKLDEMIRAAKTANNEVVGIEHLTEEEVDEIRDGLEADAQQSLAEKQQQAIARASRAKSATHKAR